MRFDKTISREIALQGIYQHLLGISEEEILKLAWVEEVFGEEFEYRNKDFIVQYSRKILNTYFSNRAKIEKVFEEFYIRNPETVPIIDKSLFFLGLTLLLMNDVSPKVVIDEVVNISKAYSSGNTVYRVVNKFLDSVLKNQNIPQY